MTMYNNSQKHSFPFIHYIFKLVVCFEFVGRHFCLSNHMLRNHIPGSGQKYFNECLISPILMYVFFFSIQNLSWDSDDAPYLYVFNLFCQIFDRVENVLLYFWCQWNPGHIRPHIKFICSLSYSYQMSNQGHNSISVFGISVSVHHKTWKQVPLRWGGEGESRGKGCYLNCIFQSHLICLYCTGNIS